MQWNILALDLAYNIKIFPLIRALHQKSKCGISKNTCISIFYLQLNVV